LDSSFILFLYPNQIIRMKKLTLVFILSIVFASCGAKKWGTPIAIEVRYDKNAEINYGHSFKARTYLKYSSGKEKEISDKKETEYKVSGANAKGNYISIPSYPENFQNDTIQVEVSYVKNELSFTTKKRIPFNYKGDLILNFQGAKGGSGADGSSGGTALLFRDGKDGDTGAVGGNGQTGHDITILVYKSAESGLYHMKVTDLNASATYYFKNKDAGFPIKIYSNGGTGGTGGDGGSGGDGKNGKKTEKKEKQPGDGGDGGDGGQGGSGANGGAVFITIHPSAEGIQSRIVTFVTGGQSGGGGAGGIAGNPGDPLEWQAGGKAGNAGNPGPAGLLGNNGPVIQVSVEDFDIDF
jgi:hypothetical protein